MKIPLHANLWLPSYLRDRARALRRPQAKRVWVAFTDHFEPCGNASLEVGYARLSTWETRWSAIAAAAPRDSIGSAPCFTFFYPQEEYNRGILDRIAQLTRDGSTDVEVHLHHFDDNARSLRLKLDEFTRRLRGDHGLLHEHHGEPVFGFIHGNWALDNSHPAGFGCGVKGELQVLRDAGCYADFTMPSLPSPTQSRIVNKIYWTQGDPERPRGFDSGTEAVPGGGRQGDLLMITGPTGLRYRDRLLPRMETGEVAVYDAPTPYRIRRWFELAPRIGNDIFLKLYGHSAREDNAAALLGSPGKPGSLEAAFRWISEEASRQQLELHWVSAFGMFQAVDALLQPQARAHSTSTASAYA